MLQKGNLSRGWNGNQSCLYKQLIINPIAIGDLHEVSMVFPKDVMAFSFCLLAQRVSFHDGF